MLKRKKADEKELKQLINDYIIYENKGIEKWRLIIN